MKKVAVQELYKELEKQTIRWIDGVRNHLGRFKFTLHHKEECKRLRTTWVIQCLSLMIILSSDAFFCTSLSFFILNFYPNIGTTWGSGCKSDKACHKRLDTEGSQNNGEGSQKVQILSSNISIPDVLHASLHMT